MATERTGQTTDFSNQGTEFEVTQDNIVILRFNLPMDKDAAVKKENYSFEPELGIEEILYNDEKENEIILKIKEEKGASGRSYILTAKNLKSAEGAEIIDGKGSTISFFLKRIDLSEVFAYPNPYKSDRGKGCITFTNLTEKAKIWITDISGNLIKKIMDTDVSGGIDWYLDNENGEKVSSGIYIYYIEGNGSSFIGKLAIVR